jgi:hypothetical protein
VFLLATALSGGALAGLLPAAETGGASAPVQAVDLEWTDVPYGFLSSSVSPVMVPTPFAKEPATGAGRIVRGRLPFGGEAANAIPFLWSVADRKLYLDLNRNQDFTDDPAGVFTSAKLPGSNAQMFNSVALPWPTAAGERRMLVNLQLTDLRTRIYGFLQVRSLWLGRITLQGEDRQLGVVENPTRKPGPANRTHLLWRPWEGRDRPFTTADTSLDALPFVPKLFVNRQAYELQATEVPAGDKPGLRLQLTATQPPLGELKFTGQLTQRLVLGGGTYLAVLDRPEGVVRVPSGSYAPPKVVVKSGANAATTNRIFGPAAAKKFTVAPNVSTELKAGGPLQNTVAASRRGKNLYLKHDLVGAGGETYSLSNLPRSSPPTFAVFQDGRKIATGKFEFG